MATWLASVLHSAKLLVEEVPGWQTRGRGEMSAVRGILVHHTGGPIKGDRPSLNLVINGRSDLPGPLSQLFLTRNGTWIVIAAGRCNHAGAGSWQGVTSGNSSFIGVEAENAGTKADPWPEAQMDAYERGCAAILKHLGADEIWVAGHREYALPRGRKIDPLFDMHDFRANVARLMKGASSAPVRPAPMNAERFMLRKGDTGKSVAEAQTLLGRHFAITADGVFGPKTEDIVKKFQAKVGLLTDGLIGPATWKALAK